jgi:hypothetical protein
LYGPVPLTSDCSKADTNNVMLALMVFRQAGAQWVTGD